MGSRPAAPEPAGPPAPGPRWPLALSLGLLLAFGVLLWAFAAAGWPGAPNPCFARGNCYCEAVTVEDVGRPGLRQPMNFWSNLGFVLSGLAMAVELGWGRAPRSPRALSPDALGLYAAAVVLLGPASMAFHGSMTWWGGLVDNLSMYTFVGFLLVNTLTRGRAHRRRSFPVAYTALCAGLLGLNALDVPGPTLVAAVVLPLLVLEPWALWVGRAQADARWFGAALGCFVLAIGVWLPSATAGPLCAPLSPWQGHAAWHVLCAAGAWALWRYLRSERPPRVG